MVQVQIVNFFNQYNLNISEKPNFGFTFILLQMEGGRSSPSSRIGGRTSPGGLSSMSTMSSMSRTTIRTPAPPPKAWRIVQPPFPPMTHTSVSTFDWKLLLDKE